MGISIDQPAAIADTSLAAASQTVGIALQSQVQTAQTSAIEALFGSLGLGTNSNSLA